MENIKVYPVPEDSVKQLKEKANDLGSKLKITLFMKPREVGKKLLRLHRSKKAEVVKLRKELLKHMSYSSAHAEAIAQLAREDPLVFATLMTASRKWRGFPLLDVEELTYVGKMGLPNLEVDDIVKKWGHDTALGFVMYAPRSHPTPVFTLPFFFWLKGILRSDELINSPLDWGEEYVSLAYRLLVKLAQDEELYKDAKFFLPHPPAASIVQLFTNSFSGAHEVRKKFAEYMKKEGITPQNVEILAMIDHVVLLKAANEVVGRRRP
ncbi:MAG: hypothetical protein GXN92_02025 [Candidatus Micrarchaeota archaeon]|nr:hypothetical protein [Candidatus Micrarchaeota archaeon]